MDVHEAAVYRKNFFQNCTSSCIHNYIINFMNTQDKNGRYRNREIDQRHEQIMERLDSIHDQVEETNGRVSELEKWRNRIVGAIAVITPIVLYLLQQIIQFNV